MKPLLKWPGGKSSEIVRFRSMIPGFDRYLEPFFGGGALFFHLCPPRAAVNDLSGELMGFYRLVKDQDPALEAYLRSYAWSFRRLLALGEAQADRLLALLPALEAGTLEQAVAALFDSWADRLPGLFDPPLTPDPAAFRAELCQIFTDVDGIYTTDPRIVPNARKLEEITYDEMLELASQGAQVLHNRSVELAKKFRVNLEVVSSLERKPGTKVKEVTKVEKTNIAGVAKDTSIARVALIGLQHNPGVAFQVFDLLSKHNINVDVILQSIGREDTKDITFTVHKKDLEESQKVLEEHKEALKFDHIETDESIGKVSIVGAGLMSNCGVAARMFEALYEAGINIQMINTSEIRVSVLLDEEDVNRAVRAIHDKFFGEI